MVIMWMDLDCKVEKKLKHVMLLCSLVRDRHTRERSVILLGMINMYMKGEVQMLSKAESGSWLVVAGSTSAFTDDIVCVVANCLVLVEFQTRRTSDEWILHPVNTMDITTAVVHSNQSRDSFSATGFPMVISRAIAAGRGSSSSTNWS